MDSFDEKHKMVQQLLAMLKNHASNEVDSGLKKPEGADDMHGIQVEKVEVLPDHEMDKATPEHEVDTKLVDEGKHTSSAGYNKGGVVDKVNATDPTPKIHSGPIPYESADGQPDMEGAVHKEDMESLESREHMATEENASPKDREYAGDTGESLSLFENLLGKKKKR